MNKQDAGGMGSALITILVFIYGIKSNRGWKYWVFTLLLLPAAGYQLGAAFGKVDEHKQLPPNSDV